MNIQNIEKKEKNMATFEVKVPADVFDNAVNEVYKKNKSQLYVAGFRKGKAPRSVIEGMYGKDVFYPEAIETLLRPAVPSAALSASAHPACSISRSTTTRSSFTPLRSPSTPRSSSASTRASKSPRIMRRSTRARSTRRCRMSRSATPV